MWALIRAFFLKGGTLEEGIKLFVKTNKGITKSDGKKLIDIFQDVQKNTGKVIKFPRDKVTPFYKARPGETLEATKKRIFQIDDELNSLAAKDGKYAKLSRKERENLMMKLQDESSDLQKVPGIAEDRFKDEFRTFQLNVAKNNPEFNQDLAKQVINREIFKDATTDQRKLVLDALESALKNPTDIEPFASGGIAGQLHLNQGGRAGFANGLSAYQEGMQLMGPSNLRNFPGGDREEVWDPYKGSFTSYGYDTEGATAARNEIAGRLGEKGKEYLTQYDPDYDIDAMRDPFASTGAGSNVYSGPSITAGDGGWYAGDTRIGSNEFYPTLEDAKMRMDPSYRPEGRPPELMEFTGSSWEGPDSAFGHGAEALKLMRTIPVDDYHMPGGGPITRKVMQQIENMKSSTAQAPATTASTPVAEDEGKGVLGKADTRLNPLDLIPGLEQHIENLDEIKKTSKSSPEYFQKSTEDMIQNFSDAYGEAPVIGDINRALIETTAPVLSAVTSPIYDIYSATQRMEPGSGAKGLWEAIKNENIPTSTANRFIGAAQPLANRIKNVGTTLGEGIYNVFNKDPRMQAAADKGMDARMGRTYAENKQIMADPRMNAPMGAAKGGLAKILGV